MESKMENPTHSFRETNLVLKLIEESEIKSKTDELELAQEKRRHFLYRLFCPNFFAVVEDLCHISICSVLNILSEYTYFYISKTYFHIKNYHILLHISVSSYSFVACF